MPQINVHFVGGKPTTHTISTQLGKQKRYNEEQKGEWESVGRTYLRSFFLRAISAAFVITPVLGAGEAVAEAPGDAARSLCR